MKRLAAGNQCDDDEQAGTCCIVPEPSGLSATAQLDFIYRTEKPSLMRRLVRRVGLDQAEDLVQQVFVRLAAHRASIAQIETPSGYLFEAARNAMRDDHRTATRRSTSAHVLLDDVTLSGPDPVSHLEARDRLARLERALGRLKPLTRNVFLARRLDGYSYAEIAEQTGLSVRAVEKQMSRAIQQLARHLDNG